MQVFNLGNLERRKSPFEGLTSSMQEDEKVKTGRMIAETDRAKLPIEQQNANTRESEAAISRYANGLALRRLELDEKARKLNEDKTNFDMAEKLHMKVSQKAFQLDPEFVASGGQTKPNAALQQWEATEDAKELAKVIKKYGGAAMARPDGNIQYAPSKDIAENALGSMKAAYLQKVKSGEPTTPQEDMAYELASLDPGLRAQIGQMIQNDQRFTEAQIAGDKNMVAQVVGEYLQMFKRTGGTSAYAKGLAGESTDANDPLGILQR